MKRVIGTVAIAVLSACVGTVAADDLQKPDATLRLSGGSVAARAGVVWGKGTPSYKGDEYPVDVKGLTVGDVGASKIEAVGDVYGLTMLARFDGYHMASAAGAASPAVGPRR
jgi:hypothetical protein